MLLETGNWMGRGSWLHESESIATKLAITLKVDTTYSGSEIQVEIETDTAEKIQITGETSVSATGLYDFKVKAAGLSVTGISKLESMPHLALFWSEDESWQACVTVFALRQLHGIRGFVRKGGDTYTFDMALEKQDSNDKDTNIVQFDPRRGKS